jgi:hypothetical protein
LQKAQPFPAVVKNKFPEAQSLLSPPVYGLGRDVELFCKLLCGINLLALLPCVRGDLAAELPDKYPQVLSQLISLYKATTRFCLGPKTRDFVADKLKGIFLVLLNYFEKLLGAIDLSSTLGRRCEMRLRKQLGQILVLYSPHKPSILSLQAQKNSPAVSGAVFRFQK